MKFILATAALVAAAYAQSSSFACNPAHSYPAGQSCISTAGHLTLVGPTTTHASSATTTHASSSTVTHSLVSQISDGQPQAGTATHAATAGVVSQISDGQPQAGTATHAATGGVVTQISDGQPQAPTATHVVTGGAGNTKAAIALLAGGAAFAMFL